MGKSNTASAAVNMDNITGGRKLKDLFRGDKVLHDNFLFKLHHQANFAVILFGVAFIFGMNYLNGNSIECKGKDVGDFEKQYCWLHGSAHIGSQLSPQDYKCKADQNEMNSEFKNDERHTHYYLWVPFVLMLCLAVIKAPRVLPRREQVGLRQQDGTPRPGRAGGQAEETQLGRLLSAGQDLPEPQGQSDRTGSPGAEEKRKEDRDVRRE